TKKEENRCRGDQDSTIATDLSRRSRGGGRGAVVVCAQVVDEQWLRRNAVDTLATRWRGKRGIWRWVASGHRWMMSSDRWSQMA
ncbi:hypothetical protein HAX54_052246, partial [Datura stramonium]|nr:hypothetical protein [Datura stramonium]